jgi:hypothetical protein
MNKQDAEVYAESKGGILKLYRHTVGDLVNDKYIAMFGEEQPKKHRVVIEVGEKLDYYNLAPKTIETLIIDEDEM